MKSNNLGGVMAVTLASALAARSALFDRRIFGAANIERHIQRKKLVAARGAGTSIATGNRHGGAHQNAREAARRVRQMEKANA